MRSANLTAVLLFIPLAVFVQTGCTTTAIQIDYWNNPPSDRAIRKDSSGMYQGLYVYGGTVNDVSVLARCEGSPHGTYISETLCFLDTPLSLAADTVLLPLTLFQQFLPRSDTIANRNAEKLIGYWQLTDSSDAPFSAIEFVGESEEEAHLRMIGYGAPREYVNYYNVSGRGLEPVDVPATPESATPLFSLPTSILFSDDDTLTLDSMSLRRAKKPRPPSRGSQ